MKIPLTILILTSLGFYSCGQNDHTSKNKLADKVKTADAITIDKMADDELIVDTIKIDTSKIKTREFSSNTYFHTEADYKDSTGNGIIIQNGFPRGGGTLIISNEVPYGHAVFWSRVVNKTDTLSEITVNFPADSIVIFPSTNAHFKLLVPPDTMTLDKVSKFSYGLENIKTFVEGNFHQPSQIQRVIKPNEDFIFYVVLLSHLSSSDKGISRAGLFLKGQDLFYRLTVDSMTSKLIPCGQIAYKIEGAD